jgi:hypothetical protein
MRQLRLQGFPKRHKGFELSTLLHERNPMPAQIHFVDPISSRRRWLILAIVAVAAFVTSLDNSIVNVALPSIQADLDLGLAGVAWVVNAYILSFAVLLLTGGRLADSFGRRRLFLVGLAAFTAASLLAGLAQRGDPDRRAHLAGRWRGADDSADVDDHQPDFS